MHLKTLALEKGLVISAWYFIISRNPGRIHSLIAGGFTHSTFGLDYIIANTYIKNQLLPTQSRGKIP